MKVYIAGKVSKDSSFGTHHWRDEFCQQLAALSNIKLINLDPTKTGIDQNDTMLVFGADCELIAQCDVFIVNLSDDISVGGSQEILIAKYLNKPVVGLARLGGKFNGSTKEYFGVAYDNYKDPFVFSTCDIVCASIKEVADALKGIHLLDVKSLSVIDDARRHFKDHEASRA